MNGTDESELPGGGDDLPADLPTDLPTELPGDLLDIKPELPIPDPYWWVPWLLVITVTLAILVPLVLWLLKRMRLPQAEIPPHERARRQLSEANGLMGQPEPFCVLVSHTLRVYLEERFELHAPEETTEEFLTELKTSSALVDSQKEMLGEFLRQCDLVKFARHDLPEAELKELLQCASRIVDETAAVDGSVKPT
ncbi:MAG: hypothetical protein CMO64_07945 [Verrucomicrobiales bacterium]|nr:hypothetical protein [Verrucomicrobiales bacterium]|tara:strand:- start:6199 stop:6783 length:585 start_codon:yes stop_codon:yes gene_type:complete